MATSFSLRDKWGLGAAAGVAVCLGLGGWAYNNMGATRGANAPLRPHMAAKNANAAGLDMPAGDAAKIGGSASLPAAEMLVVHVAGCVKNPGVYKLHVGDRINDAVRAAGGFKANAQQDALNLADTLRDADQIFVPSRASLAAPSAKARGMEPASGDYSVSDAPSASAPRHPLIVRGTPVRVARAAAAPAGDEADTKNDAPPAPPETNPPAAPPPSDAPPVEGRVLGKPAPAESGGPQEAAPAPPPSAKLSAKTFAPHAAAASSRKTGAAKTGAAKGEAKFKNPGDGMVHINSASASEFEKLPGVGPAMSGRILEYRRGIGGFKSVEQINDVKGIGEKKFAKMQPFLAL